ncbi:MAG: ABC transporter ATP-binding protein [Caldilineaceae bacterium SB0661_bin_32]|uniref:ABC transporter ATP-binding protein n=1 Tax=Caldilineaceae bacterium SB0661_bin_32 TaxID=2605255 RepID=A0A6B1DCQ7_9CHLR|nr:ABC transporter ATP-binding protein [Caldilineaceae bacterium SB0661_bin_32]
MKDLARSIRYLGRYRLVTTLAYASLFISIVAQLIVPQLVQNVLDAVTDSVFARQILALPEAERAAALEQLPVSVDQLTERAVSAEGPIYWAMVFIVVFSLARGLFAFAQAFLAQKVSQDLAFDFRNELFEKIQRLSFSYHDRNRTGQLMIRATDDVEKLRMFIGQGMLLAVQSIVLLIGSLAVLAFTNLSLTLIILPVLPVALVLFMVFGSVAQSLFGEIQRRLSTLNEILQENLAGIRVVKAFVREREEQDRFDNAAQRLMDQHIRVSKIFSFLFPFIFLISNLGQAAVVYFGGRQILFDTLTLGEWQKFSLYLIYVFFPVGQLGFIVAQMSQASASAKRIFEILDAENEVTDKPGAQPMPQVQGRVRFTDVSFRYFNSTDPVLQSVSFEAQPGETVALLGGTGSGKTTIINLIPRFYDVSEGQVLLDDWDVRDVTLDSMRRQIGIVLQETNLFTGTIRDNIAFGRPDATDAEVHAAAAAAAAHDFIVSFPDGYQTAVGERGTTLSGGQKQRVAIARALLTDPRILILDDSTSSVDVATEVLIQNALDRLMVGRTSFVIAQRISTVVNADQILVLDRGRIVDRGNHEELMRTSAIYTDIYHSQLVEDAAVEEEAPLAAEA